MTERSRSIAIILVGSCVVILGVGLMITVLPIRAQAEGFGETAIGFMGSAYFIGFILGCVGGPAAVKAVGHTRAFAGFAALLAAMSLAFPLAIDAWAWAILRGGTGLCLAVVYMVIESWLNDRATNATRGAVLSIYVIAGNIATIGGQQMTVLYPTTDFVPFSLVAILVALSLVPVALAPVGAPSPIPTAKLRIGRLYKLSPSGFVGCLLVGLAEGAFWTFGPVFGQERGLSVGEIALLMGAFLAGGTILQWPLGRLSDIVDRRYVIAFCAAGSIGTGLALAFWMPPAPWMGLALALLHGGLMLPLYPLCIAHANDFAPKSEMVEVSSGLLLLYGVGAATGPVLLGPAMETFGPEALFVLIAAVFAVMAVFVGARVVVHRVASAETRGQFAAVPKSSQSVYDLEMDDAAEPREGLGEELGK
jgi:MFS family permease